MLLIGSLSMRILRGIHRLPAVTHLHIMCSSYMKALLILGITFLCGTAASYSQEVRFDALEKDLGDIRPLTSASTEFIVYNERGDTLLLSQPKPSCGCTASVLDRTDIPPGDSAVIEVRFSASPGMMGQMSKTIAVRERTEHGLHDLAKLRIKVRIVGDVVYEPGMLRFESVIGDTVRLELKLISNTRKTVHITNLSASLLAYIDTSAGNKYRVENVQTRPFTDFDLSIASEEIAPGDTTLVYLTLHPDSKGQINGSIRIPIPDGELRIPVAGVVLRARAP